MAYEFASFAEKPAGWFMSGKLSSYFRAWHPP